MLCPGMSSHAGAPVRGRFFPVTECRVRRLHCRILFPDVALPVDSVSCSTRSVVSAQIRQVFGAYQTFPPTTDVFTRIYTYPSSSNPRNVKDPNLPPSWPLFAASRDPLRSMAKPTFHRGFGAQGFLAIEILTSTLCFPLHPPLYPESARTSLPRFPLKREIKTHRLRSLQQFPAREPPECLTIPSSPAVVVPVSASAVSPFSKSRSLC